MYSVFCVSSTSWELLENFPTETPMLFTDINMSLSVGGLVQVLPSWGGHPGSDWLPSASAGASCLPVCSFCLSADVVVSPECSPENLRSSYSIFIPDHLVSSFAIKLFEETSAITNMLVLLWWKEDKWVSTSVGRTQIQ